MGRNDEFINAATQALDLVHGIELRSHASQPILEFAINY